MKSKLYTRLYLGLSAITLALSAPSAYSDTVTFNTAGTTNWLCPDGVNFIQVECWGGGGAGGSGRKDANTGGNTAQNGGGGGGGAYARRVAVPVTPGINYTITIPPAAVSGSNGTTTNGQGRVNGSSVTFVGDSSVTVTAAGGTGGANAYITGSNTTTAQGGGAGGTTAASVGDVGAVFAGGAGAAGTTGSSGASGSGGGGGGSTAAGSAGTAVTGGTSTAAATPAPGGAGGSIGGGAGGSGFGAGAVSTNFSVGGPGAVAGGGGGGGHNVGQNTRLGGTGGLGQITITFAGPIVKANNTDDLNLTTSWVGGVVPDIDKIAVWNDTVTSANTTILAADATWAGMQISDPAGVVTINSGNVLTLGSAPVDIDMSTATQDATLNCDLVLGAANVWNVAASRALTLGGAVSGAAAISKQGTGSAILSGAVTHTGATTVSAGTLTVAPAGSITTASNILLSVSGASAVANIDGSYTSTGGGGIAINSGGILNTSGTVAISGANNQAILLGTSAGSGTWNVTGGSVSVNYTSNGWGIGNTGTGTLNVSAGSVTTAATNVFNVGHGAGGTGILTVSGTGLITINAGTGAFNLGANATSTGIVNLDGGTLALGRNITKNASSSATFNFNGGLLRAGLSSATFMSGLTTANVRDGGAKIDTNGFNITIGQPLLHSIIGGDNATDGGLTKSGNGILILSGANTYNGGTLVNGGTLKFAQAVPATTDITVAGGAEAGVLVGVDNGQWVNTGNLILQNSGGVVIDYGSTAPSITTAPIQVTNFTIGTTPGVRLISNPTSALVVGQVYPLVTWTGSGPSDGTAFASLTHRLAGTFSVSSNTLFFTVTNNTVGSPISWNTGNGTWDTVAVNWVDTNLAATTYFDTLDTVLFGDATGATGNPIVTLGSSVSPLGVTMNSTSHDYTISGAGSISGSGSLVLDAANTRTFTLSTASNSYTGGTTVNGGTLVLGDATNTLLDTGAVTVDGASAILSLGTNSDTVGAVSLKNAASITGSGTVTATSYAIESGNITANLAGTGGLTKSTVGNSILSGNNSYAGVTTVTGGTLTLAGNNSATTGATNIGGGTVIATNINAFNTIANVAISTSTASGILSLATDTSMAAFPLTTSSNNPGTIILDRATMGAGVTHVLGSIILANNIYTVQAGSNVTSGTPIVSFASANLSAGSAGTSTLNPTTASILILGPVNIGNNNFAKTLALSGDSIGNEISGDITNGLNTLTITKTGTSTWTLSGANTYTGATTVSQGKLILSGARTGTSGAIAVSNVAGQSAILDITNGTYALGANAMNIGNAPTTAASATVNQSGGAISFTSGNAVLVGQNTVGNTGTYNLSGGSITTYASATRGVMIGVNTSTVGNTTGIFNLTDSGVLNMTAASGGGGDAVLQIGRYDSAANDTIATFNQTGGTANVGILSIGGNGTTGTGITSTMSLTGGTFSANQFPRLALGNTNTATITIGGTAQVTLPAIPLARGTSSSASITFDSGVTGYLRPLASSTTFIQAATFSTANLTANGAKFDTNGFDITIGQVLQNAPSVAGTLTKSGVGILSLTGANTYTGNTTVTEGTLDLADNAQLKFVLGATSGVNNSISGAGTVTLDGDFAIDTTAADALASGSWTLENVPSLSGAYGATFTVVGFVDAGSNKWTKVNGAKLYTFDETTGILTLAPSASYAAWAAINAIGSAANLDKDGDGVNNAVEYVLGGDVGTNDISKLPQSTISGTNLIFTFLRDVDTIDGSTIVEIEVGTNLTTWPTVYTVGANTAGSSAGVVVTEDSSPGFDTITLTVPMGTDPTKFARLAVEVP